MKHAYNGKMLAYCALEQPLVAIVRIPLNPPYPPLNATQTTGIAEMIRPLQQVTLRQDKITPLGHIRLGETQGDEANCWISIEHVEIVEVLGRSVERDGAWRCEPFEENADALDTATVRRAA